MSGPSTSLETIARLDRIAGRHVPAILRLDPRAVERLIDGLLGEIGDAVGASQTAFAASADAASCRSLRAWTRPGFVGPSVPSVTVPVAVAGRRLGVLTVRSRADGEPIPPSVEERLHGLADLLALVVQCAEQGLALERARLETAATPPLSPDDEGADPNDFDDIIGDSPALHGALDRVVEVAPTDAPVVLVGETGTGKRLFARAIHNRSRRRGRPFVRANCAALPPTLIESELFGHERGAFTGAVSTRRGCFELAHTGTLFLDEIGDLPADVQEKLLRVLHAGECTRVGSSEPRRVDVRVVAATRHDLEAAVKAGRFRADLFYRLNVFPIALPPLRDRADDIPRLAWFFVHRRQRALNRRFTRIPPAVLDTLQRYAWPGNVAELENVIERAMIHSTGDTLLLNEGPGPHIAGAAAGGTLEDVERQYIEQALRRSHWRINGPGNAADMLGLHPNTLRFRMKKLGLQRPKGLVVLDSGRISA